MANKIQPAFDVGEEVVIKARVKEIRISGEIPNYIIVPVESPKKNQNILVSENNISRE